MTRPWLATVLAVAGAIALAAALSRFVVLDLPESVLLLGLGPSLACLTAAVAAWFAPRYRLVAAGALIALGTVSVWGVLWSSGWEPPATRVVSAVGAVLVTVAGGLLIRGQHRPDVAD